MSIKMLPLDAAAAAWLLEATPEELVAYARFKKDGCKSCGDKASPGCACWTEKIKYYMKESKPT
jgi:hypothetical protein